MNPLAAEIIAIGDEVLNGEIVNSNASYIAARLNDAGWRVSRHTVVADEADAILAAFAEAQEDHIAVYGAENHLRLTGLHETQAIDTFSYGVADRGASIRVPHSFVANGYRGYLEDRRPNSQADPYEVTGRLIETIATVPVPSSNGSVPVEALAATG